MQLQPNLYSLALLVSASAGAMIARIVWRRRTVPGAKALMLLALALMVWALTYAAHWAVVDPSARRFWLDATYLGVVVAPSMLLAFVLQFTNRSHWLTRRNIALLAIEPIVTMVLLWTDSWHGGFFAGLRSSTADAILNGGLGFWLNAIYSYSLLLIANLLLLQAFVRAPRLYRGQTGTILLGALLSTAASFLSVTNLSPFPNLDLTPFVFTLTGLIFAYGILHYRLLDIVPVARYALVESMSDGVLVLDAQDRIVDINPAAQQLLGLESTPIGQPAGEALPMWPNLAARHGDASSAQKVLLQPEAPRYLELQMTPLYDPRRNLTGRLITLRNITERHRAEEQLHQANLELQARNEELDAFAHTVAHDLKNPVHQSLCYAEVLEQDYDALSDSERHHALRALRRIGDKINNILDELLLLSEVRKQDVKLAPLDMRGIVDEARQRVRHLVEECQAEIILPSTWPEAMGHAPWVEEVWVNYLTNGCKYGGQPPRLELGGETLPDGRARFWVHDNGEGITPDDQMRLFMPFTRLDQVRARGHGLGLSIVRRIVEKLGGQVSVESEGVPGHGSTFSFTLPGASQATAP